MGAKLTLRWPTRSRRTYSGPKPRDDRYTRGNLAVYQAPIHSLPLCAGYATTNNSPRVRHAPNSHRLSQRWMPPGCGHCRKQILRTQHTHIPLQSSKLPDLSHFGNTVISASDSLSIKFCTFLSTILNARLTILIVIKNIGLSENSNEFTRSIHKFSSYYHYSPCFPSWGLTNFPEKRRPLLLLRTFVFWSLLRKYMTLWAG